MSHPNRSRNPGPAANPQPQNLKDFRERYQLTVEQAATLAMSTRTSWELWEAGARRMHPAIWAWVQHAANRTEES